MNKWRSAVGGLYFSAGAPTSLQTHSIDCTTRTNQCCCSEVKVFVLAFTQVYVDMQVLPDTYM